MWDITAYADRIENIKASGRSKKVSLKVGFLKLFTYKVFSHLGIHQKVAKFNKDSVEKRKKNVIS